jgi:hypothetical protein
MSLRTPISGSSTIRSVGYSPADRTLDVEFHSGSTYRYKNVPDRVYKNLVKAKSVGSHHSDNVAHRYKFEKL